MAETGNRFLITEMANDWGGFGKGEDGNSQRGDSFFIIIIISSPFLLGSSCTGYFVFSPSSFSRRSDSRDCVFYVVIWVYIMYLRTIQNSLIIISSLTAIVELLGCTNSS